MTPAWLEAGMVRSLNGKDGRCTIRHLALISIPRSQRRRQRQQSASLQLFIEQPIRMGMEREVMIQKQMNRRAHDVLIRAAR